ncbi:MAG: inorganic polyphosphate/ATP-NAD kinase [Chloroflexi bacterium OLB14]|nr:MAG: inorganic polyphosphate/ATP-NAD kinase [Chloroflexi bacterium OLB14]
MNFEKIILVTRKTRLEGLIERFNTVGQAKFYLEHSGGNFDLYQREHDRYYQSVEYLRAILIKLAKFHEIERAFLPNFLFSEKDIVVTVGIDGLVVNTAKYLDGQPLVAVNPDPEFIDGVLLPFNVQQTEFAVQNVLKGQFQNRLITMAEVSLNDGQTLLAFNDLFIGVKTHVSARYTIQQGILAEHHSSSGIIVSTGVGSTGWFSSIINMANGVVSKFDTSPEVIQKPTIDWEDEKLVYVVREPFISKTTGANIVCGYVTPSEPLLITSEMPDGGVIFSDGVESDFLAFNAGAVATIKLADKKKKLISNTAKK